MLDKPIFANNVIMESTKLEQKGTTVVVKAFAYCLEIQYEMASKYMICSYKQMNTQHLPPDQLQLQQGSHCVLPESPAQHQVHGQEKAKRRKKHDANRQVKGQKFFKETVSMLVDTPFMALQITFSPLELRK